MVLNLRNNANSHNVKSLDEVILIVISIQGFSTKCMKFKTTKKILALPTTDGITFQIIQFKVTMVSKLTFLNLLIPLSHTYSLSR